MKLKEQIENARKILSEIGLFEPYLPDESETCRYALVEGAILMYIPHNPSLFQGYKEDLLVAGFEIDKGQVFNKMGVVEGNSYSSDTLRFIHSKSGIKLLMCLELRHEKSTRQAEPIIYSGPMPEVTL